MTSPGDVYRVDLPWTVPPLLASDHRHAEAHATLARNVGLLVRLLAARSELPTAAGRARIELHWAPPMGRKRSARLIAPSLRAVVGGLRDFHLSESISSRSVIEPPAAVGRCWLTIEVCGADAAVEDPGMKVPRHVTSVRGAGRKSEES